MVNVKLNFLHICEKAFLSQDGKLNIIGIFNRIGATSFPAAHPELFVVASIKDGQGVYNGKISFEAPSGIIIADARGQINIEASEGTGNIIASFRNVVFPSPGKYNIKFFINDNLLAEEYLFLTQG